MVVLISTTAFPSWAATLITADSSVRVLLIGASGATTVLPVGVTLIKRGARKIVAPAPTSPPISALISTTGRIPIRRRGLTTGSTGDGRGDTGSGVGGRNCGSLAIELRPILRWHLSAPGQWKPRKDQLLGPLESCLLVKTDRLRI